MKIKVEDIEAIESALKAENGKAKAHVIASAAEVQKIAFDAEGRLNLSGVPQKDRIGTTVTFTPKGPGKQYAKRAQFVTTTQVVLHRARTGWNLVGVKRVDVHSTSEARLSVQISATAAEGIQRRAIAQYDIAA